MSTRLLTSMSNACLQLGLLLHVLCTLLWHLHDLGITSDIRAVSLGHVMMAPANTGSAHVHVMRSACAHFQVRRKRIEACNWQLALQEQMSFVHLGVIMSIGIDPGICLSEVVKYMDRAIL